jgi:glycosyltransferase involved in cell wall biosynthesis
MKASIIICTYNSGAYLARSLNSLISQDFPSDEYEIIAVENNSRDTTRKVFEIINNKSSANLKYVLENNQV